MRICFLTHYYPPEVGAPQARISALARELSARGAGVTVHTGFPNYPEGVIRAPYRNRPWMVERDGAVRVVRTAIYPAPNRGFARRILNHTSMSASALAGAGLSGPADVVVCESPPLFLAGAAIPYARLKRAPLLLNVADRWPASAVELGALSSRRAIEAAELLERVAYRSAAAVSVPTEGLVHELDSLPSAHGKVVHLGPAVDVDRFDAAPPRPNGRLRVLYAGTVGMAQGLDTLVEAASRAGSEAVEVVVAGDGADAPLLRERVARERIDNVRMVGSVSHGDVPRLYADADAAVVLLRDRPLFERALPTKMLEAMAAGQADRAVGTGRGGSARERLRRRRGGPARGSGRARTRLRGSRRRSRPGRRPRSRRAPLRRRAVQPRAHGRPMVGRSRSAGGRSSARLLELLRAGPRQRRLTVALGRLDRTPSLVDQFLEPDVARVERGGAPVMA